MLCTYSSKILTLIFSNHKIINSLFQAGPVRLFVPYKRRKRESSVSGSPVMKKSMSFTSDYPSKTREGEMTKLLITPEGISVDMNFECHLLDKKSLKVCCKESLQSINQSIPI